jgi:3-oxoadipate enol-lactonase
MQTIIRKSNVIHVRAEGPEGGRPVIFANSLGTDLRVWDTLLPHLAPGLRLVRYDKQGHGLSDLGTEPLSIADLAEDAAAVLEGIGAREALFVGLSIGGLIGQQLAHARPDLVGALVLMDTAAKIGAPEMWQSRIDGIARGGIASLAEPILERWFTPEFRASRPGELALWRNMLCRTTSEGYAGCCAAIAGADLTETTRALTLPVMAMAGDQDGSTPPDLVAATAALCGAPFHVIGGAGHLPCVEQPQATAALINAFLKETDRG